VRKKFSEKLVQYGLEDLPEYESMKVDIAEERAKKWNGVEPGTVIQTSNTQVGLTSK
jgi:hypothetical protein